VEPAEVDAGLDRAPDAPPQDAEILYDPDRIPAQIVLVLGDPVYQSPGGATPGKRLERLRTAQKADEHRDQLLHAGAHASRPQCRRHPRLCGPECWRYSP